MEHGNIDIFNYMDYKEFLKDYYRCRHAQDRTFSHRKISELLGDKSPSFFLKVMQDGRKLKAEQLDALPAILQLDSGEASYFKVLYHYGNAKNKSDREFWLSQILSKCNTGRSDLGEASVQFYAHWLNSPVRAALSFIDIDNDTTPLVRTIRPRPTPTQVKESLQTLKKLGLIARNAQGFWKPAQSAVFARSAVHESLLKSYRLQSLDLARDALLGTGSDWPMHFYTTTFSISEEAWNRLNDRLQKFRQEMRSIINEDESPPARVVQLQQIAFSMTD